MVGDLTINGKDAFTAWGLSLDDTSLSALMTPAGNKPFIENKSRSMQGKRVLPNNPKKDERTLVLSINITAPNRSKFLSQYLSFCTELESGVLHIETKYTGTITYKMIYEGCRQFDQFNGRIGKFLLSLVEPNPMDRNENL